MVSAGIVLVALAEGVGTEAARIRRFTFSDPHMGTRFDVVLYSGDTGRAREAATAAFRRVAVLDGIMSDYRPASELMRLCKAATESRGRAKIAVSDDLFRVLAHAQVVARASGGAFDVTLGPVTHLWRRARRLHEPPDAQALAQAMSLVGYQHMHLDPASRSVRLDRPGMLLDLGGIGKGYAADEALKVIASRGSPIAMVAAGGDIAAGASPPGASGWRVAVARVSGEPRAALLLHHSAVSTSGDSEQSFEMRGQRYSHIIDPRTGLGVTGRRLVTVVAPCGLVADPLTKVVSVLGEDKGFAVIKAMPGVSARLECETTVTAATTASFPPLVPLTDH